MPHAYVRPNYVLTGFQYLFSGYGTYILRNVALGPHRSLLPHHTLTNTLTWW